MSYHVRNLCPTDFETLMRLEQQIFGGDDEDVLGPYYVRLCCDFFGQECFAVEHDGEVVGYLLSFVRDREAYCTTLAVVPTHQGGRAVHLMIRAYVRSVIGRVDRCWFTVKEDNAAARALHAALGAEEVGVRHDFYGPGDERIVACIDQDKIATLRQRYERLGLLPTRVTTDRVPALGLLQ